MTRRVEILRLSGLSAPDAVRSADQVVHDRTRPDLSCLLILDDAVTLPDHGAALEHLLASGRVGHFVCLAVGRPAEPGLVRLPGSVSAWRDSAILWVGDQFGVDWVPGAATVAMLRPVDGPDGLRRLVEILSSAEVYDKVRELAAKVPNAIACPGLRLAETEADRVGFAAAAAEAIESLEPQLTAAQVAEQPFTELLRGRVGSGLSEAGELSRGRLHCAMAAQDADRALRGAAGLAGLAGTALMEARDLTSAAGDALGGLRGDVSVLLGSIPAYSRMTEAQRERLGDRLRRAGISVDSPAPAGDPASPAPPGREPAAGPATVATSVAAALRGGETLPQVTARLAATERLLRPSAAVPDKARLDQCCPQALVDLLREPPPFPPAWPGLPLAGALAAALAGLAGIAAAVIAALAWTGLVLLAARRASAAGGPWRGRAGSTASLHLLAALAGGAAGAALSLAAAPAAPVAAGCVILALVTGVTAVLADWRVRAAAWRGTLSPRRAADAAAALADLVVSVAGTLGSADAACLDAVARARIVVEATRDELRDYAAGQRVAGRADPRLGLVLGASLRELTAGVVLTQLALPASDGDEVRAGARARTAGLIAAWAAHAEEHGLLAPPAQVWAGQAGGPWRPAGPGTSAGRAADAAAPVMLAWRDSVREAIGADPQGLMWQLCLPADIALLDVGGAMPALPFAPASIRAALSGAAPPDTEWTPDGQRAGLLRLVPIRLAAIAASWPAEDEQEQQR